MCSSLNQLPIRPSCGLAQSTHHQQQQHQIMKRQRRPGVLAAVQNSCQNRLVSNCSQISSSSRRPRSHYSTAATNHNGSTHQQHTSSKPAMTHHYWHSGPTAAVHRPQAALQWLHIPKATLPIANKGSAVHSACAAVTAAAPAVALDVEYSHFLLADCSQVAAAAWVAAVDGTGKLLLKTYVAVQAPAGARWIGGVDLSKCSTAPPLQKVVQQLQCLLQDQLLVGHGLAKDLAALELVHPPGLQFDTMTHTAFCNKAGNAKSLKQLAQQYLNRQIQATTVKHRRRDSKHKQGGSSQGGSSSKLGAVSHDLPCDGPQQHQVKQRYVQRYVHDPEEDAAAVMELYQKVVWPSTYEGQVAAATQRLVLQFKQRQQDDSIKLSGSLHE